eukprot:127968-Pyramimonas_sp.AAC.2
MSHQPVDRSVTRAEDNAARFFYFAANIRSTLLYFRKKSLKNISHTENDNYNSQRGGFNA